MLKEQAADWLLRLLLERFGIKQHVELVSGRKVVS